MTMESEQPGKRLYIRRNMSPGDLSKVSMELADITGEYYNRLCVSGLKVELANALTEKWHRTVCKALAEIG